MSPSQSSLPFGPAPAPWPDLLLRRALPAEAGVWDELRDARGALRPAWARFAQWMPLPLAGVEAADDLDRRADEVAATIRRDGVTHNVLDARGVASRPWSLELLPLLIEPAEWATIEAGARQRAALLERVLADVYGPRRLLRDGLLPPALVLRHPGYLRAMQGLRPPGDLRLYLVAFDLARGADGQWWVVAQRTQGPSGLGYVLHNRLVVSRQFPDAFRELRVQHLATSYRRLLDTMEGQARDLAGGRTPRIVLYTPGRYAETYFEHAYLARYLGLPLVEGGDLTVRADRLYLRTVEGLEPVHGVLRRVDDEWSDPLELRADSALGVPGLVQAARAGSVVVANAFGTAFLETPAVHGFLPQIALELLGEPLSLPALPTWWCGEAAAWEAVRGRLDDKVVRSTFPRDERTSVLHASDDPPVADDPDGWTVQARLRFSRAPIWGAGSIHPRPAVVRVYAIADGGGRWHVLPGGMTRVAQREDGSVSMQRGGTSLDTWVLTEGPVDTFSMLPKRLSVEDIGRRRRPLPSRAAENLYWLGRYTERTEQLVRLARTTLGAIDADTDVDPTVAAALTALALRCGLAPEGVPTLAQAPHLFERAVLAALGDAEGARSIAFDLQALERAALALRERLSSEQWLLARTMNEDFLRALAQATKPAATRVSVAEGSADADDREADASAVDASAVDESEADASESSARELPALAEVLRALDRLALQLAALTGMQSDRMTRDHGWRFLTVGRLLERLVGLTTRLDAFVASGAFAAASGVDPLLELFDSAITFRARYQRHDDLLALAELLVFDDTNPRAFAGALRRLRTELRKLPGDAAAIEPLLARLPASGPGLTLDELRDQSDAEIAAILRRVAAALAGAALALSDEIGARYFTFAHGIERSV